MSLTQQVVTSLGLKDFPQVDVLGPYKVVNFGAKTSLVLVGITDRAALSRHSEGGKEAVSQDPSNPEDVWPHSG